MAEIVLLISFTLIWVYGSRFYKNKHVRCFDKFEVELKEDRVSDYFSNDIIKVER